MFIFGHMGIGTKIVSPWSEGLPKKWLLVGTVLPDLIDKPLYYGLVLLTGKHAAELGLISGTRTFGHTGILLVLITLLAALRRSPLLAALAWGVATHLVLDSLADHFQTGGDPMQGILLAIVFPFLGFRFPVFPFQSAAEHLSTFRAPVILGGEIVGAALLFWEWWKSSHRREILDDIQERRLRARQKRSERRQAAARSRGL